MVRESEFNARNRQTYLIWLFFNVWGWLAVLALSSLLSGQAGSNLPLLDNFIIRSLLTGAVLGLVHWRALRHRFPVNLVRWGAGTAVGFLAGSAGWIWAQLLDLTIIPGGITTLFLEWDLLIAGALLGLGLGLGQCWAWQLPSQLAFYWMIANVAGWSLGLFLAEVALFLLRLNLQPDSIWIFIYFLFQGVVSGMMTGLGLLLVAQDVP